MGGLWARCRGSGSPVWIRWSGSLVWIAGLRRGILAVTRVRRRVVPMEGSAVTGSEGQNEISVREMGEGVVNDWHSNRKGSLRKLARICGVVVHVSKVYLPKEKGRLPYVYGELRDGLDGPEMAFQCRADADLPHAGERAVLEGKVKVYFNKSVKRFELRFSGRRLGSWGSDVDVSKLTLTSQRRMPMLKRSQPRVDLSRLLEGTAGRVILMGTGTMDDVQRAAKLSGVKTEFERVRTRVTNWPEMLVTAKEVATRCDAICLVRGGGPAEEFACWDEREFVAGLLALGKPFYTALGHSNYDERLAERLADQSFGTPSEFGTEYGRECKRAQRFATQRAEFAREVEPLRRLEAERRQVEERLGEAAAREGDLRRRVRMLLVVIGVLAVLVVVGVGVLVWR
jgi:hypothetical protein